MHSITAPDLPTADVQPNSRHKWSFLVNLGLLLLGLIVGWLLFLAINYEAPVSAPAVPSAPVPQEVPVKLEVDARN